MDLPEAINQIKAMRNKLLDLPVFEISEQEAILNQRNISAIDRILLEFQKPAQIIILTAEEEEFLETLTKVENYILDRKRDLELYKTLSQRYPEVNINEAAKDWAIHKLEDPLKPGNNPRSQINTWVRNCTRWNKNLKKDKPAKNNGKYNDIYL